MEWGRPKKFGSGIRFLHLTTIRAMSRGLFLASFSQLGLSDNLSPVLNVDEGRCRSRHTPLAQEKRDTVNVIFSE